MTLLARIEPGNRPMRVRAFRRLLTAQAISVAGSALSPVALALGILDSTRSRADLSFVLAANAVPMVAFLLFGHALTARIPQLRLAVSGNVVAAATQSALGALFLTAPFSLAATAALQCACGAAVATYLPTTLGITMRVVPASMLQRANATLSMARSMAVSAGPIAAGAMVATIGPGWALVADGLSFAASALILARLPLTRLDAPTPENGQEGAELTFAARIAHGMREVVRRAWVWSSICFFAFSQFSTAVFLVLGPSLLALHPGGDTRWGLVASATGVGQLAGDLLSMRIHPRRPLLAVRLTGLLGAPVLLALAWQAPLAVLALTAALTGIAATVPDTLWFTALQHRLPESSLRAVSAYDWMVSLALRPVGYLGAAALAGWIGVRGTLFLAAFLVTAASLAGLAITEVRTMTYRS
jgi:predicted MFS family arabinose efflux permease